MDNITRAVPLLIKSIKRFKSINKNKLLNKTTENKFSEPYLTTLNKKILKNRIKKYNNKKMLRESLRIIKG